MRRWLTARRLDWVERTEDLAIANHSVRTVLHARAVAASDGLLSGQDYAAELLCC